MFFSLTVINGHSFVELHRTRTNILRLSLKHIYFIKLVKNQFPTSFSCFLYRYSFLGHLHLCFRQLADNRNHYQLDHFSFFY